MTFLEFVNPKFVTVAICSTLVLGFGDAHAQQKKKADTAYTVNVKNTTQNTVEVFVADWNLGQREILHATLAAGESKATAEKAVAKITRPTLTEPETNMHWKAVTNLSAENGVPLKPGDKSSKRLSWCGETNTYRDGQTVEIKDRKC
jgi:hypothetical protein